MPQKSTMEKYRKEPATWGREVNRIIRDSISFNDIKLIHRAMFQYCIILTYFHLQLFHIRLQLSDLESQHPTSWLGFMAAMSVKSRSSFSLSVICITSFFRQKSLNSLVVPDLQRFAIV